MWLNRVTALQQYFILKRFIFLKMRNTSTVALSLIDHMWDDLTTTVAFVPLNEDCRSCRKCLQLTVQLSNQFKILPDDLLVILAFNITLFVNFDPYI